MQNFNFSIGLLEAFCKKYFEGSFRSYSRSGRSSNIRCCSKGFNGMTKAVQSLLWISSCLEVCFSYCFIYAEKIVNNFQNYLLYSRSLVFCPFSEKWSFCFPENAFSLYFTRRLNSSSFISVSPVTIDNTYTVFTWLLKSWSPRSALERLSRFTSRDFYYSVLFALKSLFL